MIDYEAMGRRIRRKRQEKSLTQHEFAAKINLSPSFYGHIERGSRVPSLDTLVLIANELGVGLDALLFDSLKYAANFNYRSSMSRNDLRILRAFLAEQEDALSCWLHCDTPDMLSMPDDEMPEEEV